MCVWAWWCRALGLDLLELCVACCFCVLVIELPWLRGICYVRWVCWCGLVVACFSCVFSICVILALAICCCVGLLALILLMCVVCYGACYFGFLCNLLCWRVWWFGLVCLLFGVCAFPCLVSLGDSFGCML